ncbi:MAG: hypothetical protein PF518_04065 [Spirochaetaceae bacterium]|jgi:hypothetical protein|nr:hypothetical protein [Spirochaetaceae bacterium]
MKRIQLILLMTILSTSAIYAVENFILEVESGVTWLHNEAYGSIGTGDSDPDPILYRIGAAFPIYISDSFFIRPSLTVISNYWQYVPVNNWAMPVDKQWGELLVLSTLLDVSFGYQLNFKSFSLAFFAGPAFNFRIPAWGPDSTYRSEMASYFYKEMNFIHIAAGFFFVIPLSEQIGLTIKGDSWIPLDNLWSSSGLPFSDGLMVTLSAGVRFIF